MTGRALVVIRAVTWEDGETNAARRGCDPTPDLAATSRKGDALASAHATAPDPTSVYRYYDRHGALIYVGITRQGMGRNLQHNGKAEWWPHVVRQEVEHLPNRVTAAAREKELIRQYRPPFNKQHNLGWQELRATYVAWAGADDEAPMSPLNAYRRAGRTLPLDVHSYDGQTLVVRTRLEHAYLVPYLFVPPGTRADNCGKRCGVGPIRVLGNFAVMDCRVRRPLRGISSVRSPIRWRQSTAQSREHIAIQRVIVQPERDDV